ncbi:MAG: hypothetical protein ACLUOI_29570 [Eisenbergiella sp.]
MAMGSIPVRLETIKNSDQVVAASVEDYSYQYMVNLSDGNQTFQDR